MRKPQVLELLGIPTQEILLGAVFLFPDSDKIDAEVITGKNRKNRGDLKNWIEWVEVEN